MYSRHGAPRAAPVSHRKRSGRLRFPRGARITRRADFDRVFASGARHHTRYFILMTEPAAEAEGTRLGLVIGKRAARRAVARNRLRRLVREVFRHVAGLPPLDLVVLARPNLEAVDAGDLRGDLERGFNDLKRKCAKS